MRQLIISLLVCLLLLAPLVWAAPLELAIEPSNITANPGDSVIYTLTVTNKLEADDSFLIAVDGPRIEWKMPGDVLLTVKAGESRETEIVFNPAAEPGPHQFTVTVSSFSEPTIFESISFNLNVEIPPAFLIKGLELDQAGDALKAVLEVEASVPTEVNMLFSLKDSLGETLNSLTASGTVEDAGTFSRTFSLEGLDPGEYTLTAEANGLTESEAFSIGEVHDVVQTVEKNSGLFSEEIVITVVNRGNVVVENYIVTQLIPVGDFITGFGAIEPTECSTTESGRSCKFLIPHLEPGKETKIVYRMDFWPSYTKMAAAILVLALFGLLYYRRVSRPRVRKIQMAKSGEEHHVILEIKAPHFKGLKNVIVRDWVSPLAHVLSKEFKHVAPIISKSDAGTELIWKLGDLAAKEERILSYKVKTLVQGHLKMPRAYLRFRDPKGNRVRIYSRSIIVKE